MTGVAASAQPQPVDGSRLRQHLIDEGILRPSDHDFYIPPRYAHGLPVLRIDAAGRAAAARAIASGIWGRIEVHREDF